MKCVICGIEINSIEESIEQGWIPYLYKPSDEEYMIGIAIENSIQSILN